MLALKMSLDFEEEVVLRLVGDHMGGPSVPLRFPSFVFPFYAPQANCCGCLTDILKIGAGCFRCEISPDGAWVRVEPFLHVDLELVLGMLVLEDIGHLPCAPMVRCGRPVELLGRAPLGYGKSSRISDGCPRWWRASELGADQEVEAWWGPGR